MTFHDAERAIVKDFFKALTDPKFAESIANLFCSPPHTALDAAQDILDAADHGHISIDAARKAVNAILDDLEGNKAKQGNDRQNAIAACNYWLHEAVCYRLMPFEQVQKIKNHMTKFSSEELWLLSERIKKQVMMSS